jgi:hypothetical protein
LIFNLHPNNSSAIHITTFSGFLKETNNNRFILKRPLIFSLFFYPLGDGMCMTFLKIKTPPLAISKHDMPPHVGCPFGVFGEGVRVSGNNTILREGFLSVFGMP